MIKRAGGAGAKTRGGLWVVSLGRDVFISVFHPGLSPNVSMSPKHLYNGRKINLYRGK